MALAAKDSLSATPDGRDLPKMPAAKPIQASSDENYEQVAVNIRRQHRVINRNRNVYRVRASRASQTPVYPDQHEHQQQEAQGYQREAQYPRSQGHGLRRLIDQVFLEFA